MSSDLLWILGAAVCLTVGGSMVAYLIDKTANAPNLTVAICAGIWLAGGVICAAMPIVNRWLR